MGKKPRLKCDVCRQFLKAGQEHTCPPIFQRKKVDPELDGRMRFSKAEWWIVGLALGIVAGGAVWVWASWPK